METFKVKEVCKSCKGTGIYSGMGERDGFGVVCHTCKGTGCHEFTHVYEEFVVKMARSDVQQVLQVNPGIGVGTSSKQNLTLQSFGGIPYTDWLANKPFPKGSEMRAYTCPAWWYQSADYSKKPDWDSCIGCGSFSGCSSFPDKHQCWERFDKENS